jgi:hypothetical protein
MNKHIMFERFAGEAKEWAKTALPRFQPAPGAPHTWVLSINIQAERQVTIVPDRYLTASSIEDAVEDARGAGVQVDDEGWVRMPDRLVELPIPAWVGVGGDDPYSYPAPLLVFAGEAEAMVEGFAAAAIAALRGSEVEEVMATLSALPDELGEGGTYLVAKNGQEVAYFLTRRQAEHLEASGFQVRRPFQVRPE